MLISTIRSFWGSVPVEDGERPVQGQVLEHGSPFGAFGTPRRIPLGSIIHYGRV
jgi:hypothetical protein